MLTLTIQYDGLVNVIESEVTVLNPNERNLSEKTIAVWDTGAIRSAITEPLARQLGLLRNGCRKPIQSVHGISYVDFATVDVAIVKRMPPVRLNIPIVESIGTDFARGMLIGMDLISQGAFALSNKNGNTVFSFMIPTLAVIDFHELINQRVRTTKNT